MDCLALDDNLYYRRVDENTSYTTRNSCLNGQEQTKWTDTRFFTEKSVAA